MTARTWPKSVLPKDRDSRFNWLMDAICDIYRELPEGQVIESLAVKTIGIAEATLIVRDADGTRKLTVGDEAEVALWPTPRWLPPASPRTL